MTEMRRFFTGFCLLLAFGAAISLNTARAEDMAKEKAIVELLKLTHTEKLMEQAMVDVTRISLGQLYAGHPEIPEKVKKKTYDILIKTFRENLGGLVAELSTVYAQTFSLEEIQGLIRFYKTDLGQKVITEMPSVMHKSMVIGGQWGRKIGVLAFKRIHEELADKGYDI